MVKFVARKLSLHLVGGGNEESRDIVPKKIDELIVGDDDQYIRLRSLQVGAQHAERSLGIRSKFLLLREGRPVPRALRRHAVMQVHEIFPLGAGFEENVGRVARRQRGY